YFTSVIRILRILIGTQNRVAILRRVSDRRERTSVVRDGSRLVTERERSSREVVGRLAARLQAIPKESPRPKCLRHFEITEGAKLSRTTAKGGVLVRRADITANGRGFGRELHSDGHSRNRRGVLRRRRRGPAHGGHRRT